MTDEDLEEVGVTRMPRRKYVLGGGYSLIVDKSCGDLDTPHAQDARIVYNREKVGTITFVLVPRADSYSFWEMDDISDDACGFASFLQAMKIEHLADEGLLYLMTGIIDPPHRGKKLIIKAIRSLLWYGTFYGDVGLLGMKPHPINDGEIMEDAVAAAGAAKLKAYYTAHFKFLTTLGPYLFGVCPDFEDWQELPVTPVMQRRCAKWQAYEDDRLRQLKETVNGLRG